MLPTIEDHRGLPQNEVVANHIQNDDKYTEQRMIPPRILRIEPSPKNMMLEKSLLIRNSSSPDPRVLLPWRQRTTEVEYHRRERPHDRGKVYPDQARPDKHEQCAEYDEDDVRDVNRRDEPRKKSPAHWTAGALDQRIVGD